MTEIKKQFTEELKKSLQEEVQILPNAIFVFLGVEEYIDLIEFSSRFVDSDTYDVGTRTDKYNASWFTAMMQRLVVAQQYCIMSYAQFCYFNSFLQVEMFKERVIIVQDQLRSILPLSNKGEWPINHDAYNDLRPDNLPLYMGEIISRESMNYYSIVQPSEGYAKLNLFSNKKVLSQRSSSKAEVIDIINDPLSLDVFICNCLKAQSFAKQITVKVHEKHPRDKKLQLLLQTANGLLQKFGGELIETTDAVIDATYQPSDEVMGLLRTYWGDNASFRNLEVYKSPDTEKTIQTISQGLVVDTIITEYKNGKEGKFVKDLFLTAPTGAGKSLLFQLPAFYVASKGDVTIVVSPLIALMKDQVVQMSNQRHFTKVSYINSELSLVDRDRVIEECKNGEIDILYMAPELLLSYNLSFFIGERRLGLLVIDEAHLITTWGRDFRVDYWFLGQHINKIRKYSEYSFPMVAVTATAVYGGENDMVFDSINSLVMNDPHVFIGKVRRDDISFLIDTHDKYVLQYDSSKIKETARFIEDIHKLGIKTIVYTPWASQIDKLQQQLEVDGCKDIAVKYHGQLSSDEKDMAYKRYQTNDCKVMISTKAFGMGVDISDIQLVYHHAPSGVLPDYVQEIGRAARKGDIQGYAALQYAIEDQRYSKTLQGMSSLKNFQLKEVLKKVYKTFLNNGKKRNMTISANDFSYIFDRDVDQKVSTALMMIEKDYLAKYRFNVLIARPKKLFAKVYGRTNSIGLSKLQRGYEKYYKIIRQKGDYTYILLDLNSLWEDRYNKESFPLIKHKFYKCSLFYDEKIELKPQVEISFSLSASYDSVYAKLNQLFDTVKRFFVSIGHREFTEELFNEALSNVFTNKSLRDKIVSFFLASYAGRLSESHTIEGNAFLQRRRKVDQSYAYIVYNNYYNQHFAALLKALASMFSQSKTREASQFASTDSDRLTNLIRLGSLLEILDMASYESRGGDIPMIFIRINDPIRIKRDVEDDNYTNTLLNKTKRRFDISNELYDHFFMHSFTDSERWDFIESYFLGETKDDLIDNYPGGERNHIDIVKYLKDHANVVEGDSNDMQGLEHQRNFFTAKSEEYYPHDRLLTIDGITKSIGAWLKDDPVSLDKEVRKNKLYLYAEDYEILRSKIKANHKEYYRDSRGLRVYIKMKGYEQPVQACVVYKDNPVKFYLWWKTHENEVSMKKIELIQLLIKVDQESPKSLLKRHRAILENKKR